MTAENFEPRHGPSDGSPSDDETFFLGTCNFLVNQAFAILKHTGELPPVALFVRDRRSLAIALLSFGGVAEKERCYAGVSVLAERLVADGVILLNNTLMSSVPVSEMGLYRSIPLPEEDPAARSCLLVSIVKAHSCAVTLVPYGVGDDGVPVVDEDSVSSAALGGISLPPWVPPIGRSLQRAQGRVPGSADEVMAVARSFAPEVSSLFLFGDDN